MGRLVVGSLGHWAGPPLTTHLLTYSPTHLLTYSLTLRIPPLPVCYAFHIGQAVGIARIWLIVANAGGKRIPKTGRPAPVRQPSLPPCLASEALPAQRLHHAQRFFF